jgi:hypothetical protein
MIVLYKILMKSLLHDFMKSRVAFQFPPDYKTGMVAW